VIILTLVAQGMTLPAMVRRLRLTENPSVADAERQARAGSHRHYDPAHHRA
jgi:hypothetical protein